MGLIDKIQVLPPLSVLPREEITRVLSDARLKAYAVADVLFTQGDMPAYLYVLQAGTVKLWSQHHDNVSITHNILVPGAMFVLPAVLSDSPYIISATVIRKSELLLISAEHIRNISLENARLASFFLMVVSHQYRQDRVRWIEAQTLSTAQRLARFLLQQNREQNDSRMVTLPYSKRILAAELKMTPESLSRALFRLKRYISLPDHTHIRIKDIDGLSKFGNPDNNHPDT